MNKLSLILFFLLVNIFSFGQKEKNIDKIGDFSISKTTIRIIDTLKGSYKFYSQLSLVF